MMLAFCDLRHGVCLPVPPRARSSRVRTNSSSTRSSTRSSRSSRARRSSSFARRSTCSSRPSFRSTTSKSTSTSRRLRSSARSLRSSRTSRSSRMAGRWSRRTRRARLSLPSDRSFESYEQAAQHVAEPLERGTSIYIDQGYVDARITYPISSPGSEFSIRTTAGPELGDYLKLALRYMPPAKTVERWSSPAARERSRSTRRGCAPRRASSGSASRTSSPATIICCSCFAW